MAFALKAFRKTLMYEGSPSTAQLQANLKQIAAQDKEAEKHSRTAFLIAIALGVSSVILLIFGAEVAPALTTLAIIALMAALTVGLVGARWQRLNVPDIRYMLSTQLAEMLSRDMAKGAALKTRIDFSKPTAKKKKVSQGPWPARKGWKQACFEDPWLFLSGCFLDNTQFSLTLTELTVVRSGWKRSRSGKSKRKVKTKPKGMEARLFLQFPRKKYGAVTALQSDIEEAVTLPPGAVLKKIKVSDHQLLLQVKVGPHRLNEAGFYQLFTQMLLSAYHVLNLSKALSKQSA